MTDLDVFILTYGGILVIGASFLSYQIGWIFGYLKAIKKCKETFK